MKALGYKQTQQAVPNLRQDKFVANKQSETPLKAFFKRQEVIPNLVASEKKEEQESLRLKVTEAPKMAADESIEFLINKCSH